MDVVVVGQAQVRALLPMPECITVMDRALRTLAQGNAVQPLRSAMRLPDGRGLLGVMPAYLGDIDASGIKVVTVYPGNHGTRYDSHQGVVVLFDGERGCALAILDGTEVTAIRTAAVSAVATRLLARQDAEDLAILGTGVQARTHLEAIATVRPLRRVRVWSRDAERTRRFAARHSQGFDVDVEPARDARSAVEGASIVCTTTASNTPILHGAWLQPGTHVNAVGACTPNARELDTAAVVRSRLFVDRRESAQNEAGDFLIPKAEGKIDDGHIQAEIGELLTGQARGRSSDDEVTLFKSLGLGVEDVAVAHHVYTKARAQGVGTTLELGGARDDPD